MNYTKLIYNPEYFPFGLDTIKCYPINNSIFFKKFRNNCNNFNKTILYLKFFEKYNFTPKIISYNEKNKELYTNNCGNLLKIENLPTDWESQLLNVKNILKKHELLLNDWGLWRINPFIINNLTLKNNKIYFIDLGDLKKSNKNEIEHIFNQKINKIKLMIKWKYLYLLFHYFEIIYLSKKTKKILLFYFFWKLFSLFIF